MRAQCICIAVAASLTACAGDPAPMADVSHIGTPPSTWMVAPKELPDVPKCDKQPDPKACRAKYDITERTQHATSADHLRRLQGWVRNLTTKPQQ